MADYGVERPVRFHTSSFRPIANLLKQRRPASFGESLFKKKAQVNWSGEVVHPQIMKAVEDLLRRDPEQLQHLQEQTGAEDLAGVIEQLKTAPEAITQLLHTYGSRPGEELYADLARKFQASQTGVQRMGEHAQAANVGGNIAGSIADVVAGPSRVGQIAQLLPMSPLAVLGGSKVNPYEVGADPATQNAVQQVQLTNELKTIQQQLANPNTDEATRAKLAQRQQEIQASLPELMAGAQAAQATPTASDYVGGTIAEQGVSGLQNLTTAAASPFAAKVSPLVGGVARAPHYYQEARQRGASGTEAVADATALGSTQAAADLARTQAMLKALPAAAPGASRGAQIAARLRALPGAARAGAASTLALPIQAAGSLFEGVRASGNPQEEAAIEEEWAQQMANRARSGYGVGDAFNNLVAGGVSGGLSFSSADRRPFRAAAADLMSAPPPEVTERMNQILMQRDFQEARNTFAQQLTAAYPGLKPEQVAALAEEGATRQTLHNWNPSGVAELHAGVDLGDGNLVDMMSLKPYLANSTPEQQQSVEALFRLAPNAAIHLIDPDNGGVRPEIAQRAPDAVLPMILDPRGQRVPVRDVTEMNTQSAIDAGRQQEAAHADTLAQQRAQDKAGVEAYGRREQAKIKNLEVAQSDADLRRGVEHRNRIAALRKPQQENLAWRKQQDPQWGFDKAAPAMAQASPLPPPVAGNVMAATPKPVKPVVPAVAQVPPQTKVGSIADFIPRWR